MRFVRLLSTSCQRSKQALFEPYVRPLTSEQKAYLRKVERRYLPVFHLYLSKDMEAALTVRSSSWLLHSPSYASFLLGVQTSGCPGAES